MFKKNCEINIEDKNAETLGDAGNRQIKLYLK